MDDRTRRLVERVKCELAEHLEDADVRGGRYVEEYVSSMVSGRQKRPRLEGLHPQIGVLVRELALDASAGDAVVRRR